MKLFVRPVYLERKDKYCSDYDMSIIVMANDAVEATVKCDVALNEYKDEYMDVDKRDILHFNDSKYGQVGVWLVDEDDWFTIRPETLYK